MHQDIMVCYLGSHFRGTKIGHDLRLAARPARIAYHTTTPELTSRSNIRMDFALPR